MGGGDRLQVRGKERQVCVGKWGKFVTCSGIVVVYRAAYLYT